MLAVVPLLVSLAGAEEHATIALEVDGVSVSKRYVLRVPTGEWNGALVVGAHGGRGGETYHRDGSLLGTDEISLDDVVGDYALERGFAYASVDRDGLGSSLAALSLTREFTAKMRARVEAHTGGDVERCYLVGLSMGGGVARYAAELPDSGYDGVVLIAGAGGDRDARQARARRMAEAWPRLEERGPASYAAAVGTPVEAERFWPFMGRSSLRRPEASPSAEVPDTSGRVRVPTLEVVGTFDDFVFPEVERYREKVRAAGVDDLHRLYAVEGAWHMSPDDDGIESFQYIGSRMGLSEEAIDAMATGASYLGTAREALSLLERWVVEGVPAPASRRVAEGESLE